LASLRGKSKFISTLQPRTIAITFNPSYEGHFVDTLELHFHDLHQKNQFSIIRRIEASLGSLEDHEQLKAKAPYHRKKRSFVPLPKVIVPSLRPPTWTKTKWHMSLPSFEPPQDLIRDAFGSKNPRKMLLKNHLPAVFNEHSHGKWFQILLYIEDEQRRSVLFEACCLPS
jgi:helicase MOV-10